MINLSLSFGYVEDLCNLNQQLANPLKWKFSLSSYWEWMFRMSFMSFSFAPARPM